ncbi:hypothetical protein [Fulvivirga lutimaris]|uniref:hypothetical protein n=1 Tax=Fulvivirga lutimaris TaxID=1819566 RepID=UPI0012BBAB88|nr:hypothetical protein [Fulvivirga lutimaris]MTI41861.1 hypothetical protein [Fulvivirga lutimaris]
MKTSQKIILLVLILVSPVCASAQKTTDTLQTEWIKAINSGYAINDFYNNNSGLLLDGEFILGQELSKTLHTFIRDNGEIGNYELLETHRLRDNQKMELGKYAVNNKTFYSVIGWKRLGEWTKEFEVIYEHTPVPGNTGDVAATGRQAWEDYANEHRPDQIIKNVSAKNGMYFNRGSLYHGDEIIEAYGYMTNESYHIKLESMSGSMVNEDTFFDIGTFQVGGKGLYLLIWTKEGNDWKILLDFNF